jgi:HlyD family secretion protein
MRGPGCGSADLKKADPVSQPAESQSNRLQSAALPHDESIGWLFPEFRLISSAVQFILGRMINNWSLALVLGTAIGVVGCALTPQINKGFAGVVEFEQALLGFERTGRVATRPVERGSQVAPGDLLGTLDDTLDRAARSAEEQSTLAALADVSLVRARPKPEDVAALSGRVEAARAAESKLRANYERDQQLVDRGVLPASVATDLAREVERAAAERAGLEAQLASLRRGSRKEEVDVRLARAEVARASLELQVERLKKNELRAPAAGTIAEVYADPGEIVAPGAPLVSLVERDHPLVQVFVPVGKLGGLKIGTVAHARVDAYSKRFSGTIEYISPSTEFTPRYIFSDRERPRLVVRVRVRLEDPEHELVEGVPAFVEFEKS